METDMHARTAKAFLANSGTLIQNISNEFMLTQSLFLVNIVVIFLLHQLPALPRLKV